MPKQEPPLMSREQWIDALAEWAIAFEKKLSEREQSQKEAS